MHPVFGFKIMLFEIRFPIDEDNRVKAGVMGFLLPVPGEFERAEPAVKLSCFDFLLELKECAAVMYAPGFLCLFLAQLLEVPEQRFAFQTLPAIEGQVIPQAFCRGK